MSKPLREWIHCIFKESATRRILFRVDAGNVHGLSFGHASRCVVLARVLKDIFGSESLFLMRDYTDGIEYVLRNKQKVKTISVEVKHCEEKEHLVREIDQFNPEWLVVDLPYNDLDTPFFSYIRQRGVRILFIDDHRFITPNVDVILNSSILALGKTKKVLKGDIRYFLGPKYFIFDSKQIVDIPPRENKRFIVSISFGGSDPGGLTEKTLRCLSQKYWKGIFFRVILGPGYRGIEEIRKIIENFSSTAEIVVNPENIFPHFSRSDLVVCAGGQTIYELLVLGIPTLAIASIKHEVEVIKKFSEEGLILTGLLSWNKRIFLERLQASISRLKA